MNKMLIQRANHKFSKLNCVSLIANPELLLFTCYFTSWLMCMSVKRIENLHALNVYVGVLSAFPHITQTQVQYKTRQIYKLYYTFIEPL